MAFRTWNALPPETLPAQLAGSLFDGDEGPANVRFEAAGPIRTLRHLRTVPAAMLTQGA